MNRVRHRKFSLHYRDRVINVLVFVLDLSQSYTKYFNLNLNADVVRRN